MPKILFTDISELVTNQGVARKGGVNVTAEDLGIIENGALLWDTSKGVLWMGKSGAIPKEAKRGLKTKPLKGKTLAPALADCHNHLVFAGSRHNEWAMRLAGATYQDIAAKGGGIVSTVKSTRAASEADLFKTACERVDALMKTGVGLLEMKSGYGLDWPTEKKMLKVARKVQAKYKAKLATQSTFLGAHSFPPGTKTDAERDSYVDEVVDKMLPAVAKEKLADACDVFFDQGYFTREQSKRILKEADRLGLEIKLHADELADTGGAALAAELGALSADHLLKANDKGLEAMAKRGVVAVLLPTTALYLGLPYAPAKKMKKLSLCLALATDFNPGSSPTLHLPFVMSLACLQMGLTMPEAFAAATYGGAKAMGMHNQHGHLRVGSKPKMAIFNVPSYQALINQIAHPGLCETLL